MLTKPKVTSVGAYPGNTYCTLGINWEPDTSNPIGSETDCVGVQFYIDDIAYTDGNSGYDTWGAGTNGIACESSRIAGGLVAGQTKKIVVRVIGKNGDHIDSDPVFYTIPSGFVCTSTSIPTPGKGKGKNK